MILVSIWNNKLRFILFSVGMICLMGCQPVLPQDFASALSTTQNSPIPSVPNPERPEPTRIITDFTAVSQTQAVTQTDKVSAIEVLSNDTRPTVVAITEVSTSEVQPTQTRSVKTVLDIALKVVTEGDVPGTWILNGDGVGDVNPGESVIIYGVLVQGTEAAIAQAQVIAQSPDSLIVQILLEHPRQDVRSGLRADNNLSQLEASVLIPAASFADGYVLSDERIRLRSDHDLVVGTVFQAYEPQMIGQRIADYLPFSPPVVMRVTNIGVTGEVASAELVRGEWPKRGTLISNVGITEPSITLTSTTIAVAPKTAISTWTSQPAATVAESETPDVVATGVAEQFAVQTAIAATVTAQKVPTSPQIISTPTPKPSYIEIIDPQWAESRQGWHTVRWRYTGLLRPGQGFDLLLWYIKEDRRRGITDARNIAEKLQRHGNNEYSVEVNFSAAAAVAHYCDAKYLLAITIVQLDPYIQIGPQSDGVQIQVAPLPGGPCD